MAARLCSVDPGSATPVGLVLPRSVDTVVAMVAASLVGRPFIPLDPDYPAGRLAMICRDAGVDVVVTSSQHRGAVPSRVPVVILTDVGATAVPVVDLPERVGPSDCAYILYTSGSTGRPKGVRVSQANLVSLLDAMAAEPGLSGDDVLLAVTSPSFDIALLELLGPLVVGASLVIAAPADVVDAARLGGLLEAHEVTVMQATPVTWQLLLDGGWAGRSGLRAWCGGEAMPVPLAERLVPRVAQLWNMYGPTETTIWSSVHRVGVDDLERQVIPIGHPIAGTGLVVVDPGLRPVPVGVYGELCITGAGVTLGYHERPDLTAERFVRLPVAGSPRAYRTGDLVRRRLDGRIEFGGRMDRQVKVRGFRIELGEVETVAATASGLPCVADVDASGQALLVFMESAPDRAPDPGALRQQMALRLPPQMLPQRFVAVEQFPHTPNGKIDRAALRRLGLAAAPLVAPTGGGRMAESELEQLLADIWQDLLGLDQPPGVEEDFFLLGGHSLLATKLVFRVRDAVGVEVPLPVLFSGDLTIEHLAQEVARAQAAPGTSDAPGPRIRPRHRDGGPVPLSSSQERMWFLEQLQPGLAMHVMSGVVRLPVVVPPDVFAECLDQVVARHESLRTRVEVRDGEPVGIVDPTVQVPFGYLDGVVEADMWATFEADATTPFRVATDPLVRATLARTDDGRCYVQITMHHLVADGHSTGILFSELGRLCEARLRGQDADLPPVPFQYADYAQWLAETDDPQTAAAVEYWRAALADAPQALSLPEDRPRPEQFTYRAGRLALELDAELSGRVRAYASAQGTTPYAVFLGAYAVALSRWAANDTVVVGTPTAQRFERGTDQVVGPFLNTLALCLSLEEAPSLREAVARAGQAARDGLMHQSLPFERVLSEVQVARDPSRSPLVQAMLNVQPTQSGGLELRDLFNGCVQFDLAMELVTTSGATTGHVDFASDVYDERTIRAIVEAFRRILQTVVADDAVTVDRVPLTPRDDLDRSVGAAGAAAAPEPPTEVALSAPTLHAAVLATAARWPERRAVTEGARSLSFGQLAERASRLADRIGAASQEPGASPEPGATPVGLVLPRSVDTVVAMVASSLAGRPFVPLDPDYPAERLAMICQDAGVGVVVTSSRHREAVPPCGATVVLTDVDELPADVGSTRRSVDPSDCAYILYTSGSTGRPKGVRASQANLVASLGAMVAEPGLSGDDVLLAVASPS
ncbi:MAG: amino acid adenylation domain-containing protein, partial [Cellulomonas sp.]|nr:amino acid adenylation domain-containing protein [Cellulomonas sp.]